MNILEIRAMRTMVEVVPGESRGVHESTLRGYQILERVKEWLAVGVNQGLILELIGIMESGERKGDG